MSKRFFSSAIALTLLAMIVAGMFGVRTPIAQAVDDSITISLATIALRTDNDSNEIANIGDEVRVSAAITNVDGGCEDAGTVVTVDMTQYGGATDEALTCVTDGGGVTQDLFRLDFTIVDAGGSGIDVADNDAASKVTVTAYDDDELNGTGSANPTLLSGAVAKAVDTIAADVTDGNISIAGGSGTGGAYIVGDTVTVTWDNSGGGDNNSDTIDGVTADLSDFGGGSTVTMTDTTDCGGSAADDIYEACYTLVEGAIDGTNLNASVTATDDGGNMTTASDSTNATVDTESPTVTSANIALSGATGTGGVFIVGDTVTATWDNTVDGDNNDDADSVTVDFTDFGGGAAVVATEDAGVWTATYEILGSEGIDDVNLNVSVTVVDDAGNDTTTADNTNASLDAEAPTVTDGNIAISGATGTGGAYIVGDTVTVTWDNTGGGDSNSDTIDSVTVDFTDFGGDSAVSATNSSDTWTATYTIVEGVIDDVNLNVSVTAYDDAGNPTTQADSTNATVDSESPTVTGPNISIDTTACTGTDQICIVGDDIIINWDNSAGGNNNSDTIDGVTVDLSDAGGSASATMYDDGSNGDETGADGIWSLQYTIVDGDDDALADISVTATDDAGNTTTTSSNDEMTVDNVQPVVSTSTLFIDDNSCTGTSGECIVGDEVLFTWDNSAEGDDNGDISSVTADLTNFSGGAAEAMYDDGTNGDVTEDDGIWSLVLIVEEDDDDDVVLEFTVTAVDDAGNSVTSGASDDTASVDDVSPTVTAANLDIDDGACTGTSGECIVGDTVTFTWDNSITGDNNSDTIDSVDVDLSDFGGTDSETLYDDGTHGDSAGGDDVWTLDFTVLEDDDEGTYAFSVTVWDDASNDTGATSTDTADVDDVIPTITDVVMSDGDLDGIVDSLLFTFSEDIDSAVAGANGFNVTSDTDHGSCTSESITPDGTDSAELTFTCTVVDTAVDDLTVALTASASMVDLAGNQIASVTLDADSDVAITDAADPVIMSVVPEDEDTGVERDTDVVITFSEAMNEAFELDTQFTTSPTYVNWNESWDEDVRIVTLTHAQFGCVKDVTVTLDASAVLSAVGEEVNVGGPVSNEWSFTTVSCSSGGGGGGGSSGTSSNSPTVTLSYPTSHELITAGEEVEVTWTYSGSGIKTVALQYSVNGGTTWKDIEDGLTPSDKSYVWEVPSGLSSTSGKIRLTAYDSGKATLDTSTVSVEFSDDGSSSSDVSDTDIGDTSDLSRDSSGRLWAPGSGVDGMSPYDGSTEEISEIQAGWFVRGEHYSSVYYVNSNLERRVFWDVNTFFTWADSWDDVVWVTDATLSTLPLTSPMLPHPEVALVKIQSDPNVYAVEEGSNSYELRLIPDEETAIALYGSSWADYVIDVDPTIFAKFSMGSDMSVDDEVDTSVMRTRIYLAELAAG